MLVLLHGLTDSCFDQALRLADHRVDIVETVEDVDLWLMRGECDAIVLDIEADGNAVTWARRYRQRDGRVPVLLVGARWTHDKVSLFDIADDLVDMPVGGAEFVARLQAVVRRSARFASADAHLGALRLGRDRRTVYWNDAAVPLTGSLFKLIETLMLRSGRVVTKEALLNALYEERDEPEMKIIDVFICKLRKLLRAAGAPDDFVETVWGRGYTIADRWRDMPPVAQARAA